MIFNKLVLKTDNRISYLEQKIKKEDIDLKIHKSEITENIIMKRVFKIWNDIDILLSSKWIKQKRKDDLDKIIEKKRGGKKALVISYCFYLQSQSIKNNISISMPSLKTLAIAFNCTNNWIIKIINSIKQNLHFDKRWKNKVDQETGQIILVGTGKLSKIINPFRKLKEFIEIRNQKKLKSQEDQVKEWKKDAINKNFQTFFIVKPKSETIDDDYDEDIWEILS